MAKKSSNKKARRTGVHHGPTVLELAARDRELGWTDYSTESGDSEGGYTTVPEELDSLHRDDELRSAARQAMRWIEGHPFGNWKPREVDAAKHLFNHYLLEAELPQSVLETLAGSQIQQIRTQFAILCIGSGITGLPAQNTDWYREEEPLARTTRQLRLTPRSSRRRAA